jgi:hypothetical protein
VSHSPSTDTAPNTTDSTTSDHPKLDHAQDLHAMRDKRPNILLILVDQLYYPNHGYGDAGFDNDIKAILSFVGSLEGNAYAKHFPGFCKLREYATVFTDHTIAESACIPGRAPASPRPMVCSKAAMRPTSPGCRITARPPRAIISAKSATARITSANGM